MIGRSGAKTALGVVVVVAPDVVVVVAVATLVVVSEVVVVTTSELVVEVNDVDELLELEPLHAETSTTIDSTDSTLALTGGWYLHRNVLQLSR